MTIADQIKKILEPLTGSSIADGILQRTAKKIGVSVSEIKPENLDGLKKHIKNEVTENFGKSAGEVIETAIEYTIKLWKNEDDWYGW